MAAGEISCLLQLRWPMPANIDLYTEFRCETNGLTLPHGGRSLLGALSYHALSSITKEEKQDMRDLVLTGGPSTSRSSATS